jgi:hypothetical protein
VLHNEWFWRETHADELGHFLFRGVPPGDYVLKAGPPWGSEGLLSSLPIPVGILSSTYLFDAGVITLPQALKSVSGHVVEAGSGIPVIDAVVAAHRLDEGGFADTLSDPTGAFTLSLSGGEWYLGAKPFSPGAEWVFPGPPVWVGFELPPTQTEVITGVVLEVLPTNAWVSGQVVPTEPSTCPGPTPCPFAEEIWVELRSDDIVNGAGLDPSGNFVIPIPAGWYELIVHVEHPFWQSPRPIPVHVGPGETLNLPPIQLRARNARISGLVSNYLGIGLPGVPVVAWQQDGFGWSWAETDASGAYTLPVAGGSWVVEPLPWPEMDYIYRGHPKSVHVAPHGQVTGIDFVLTYAAARIEGFAVDAHSGDFLWWLDGWAWSAKKLGPGQFTFFSEAPMWGGNFMLKVKGGHDYAVGIDLPPHAPYVSGAAGPFSVGPSGYVSVAVPLEPKDAMIHGHLVDVTTGLPPTQPVWGAVFGEDEGRPPHWVHVDIDADAAEYALAVISGTWHLNAWVDPSSGYVALPTTKHAYVESGQVVVRNFPILPINSYITGQVLTPGGDPLTTTAFVFAEGHSPIVGYFEAHGETNPDGGFELRVPYGTYAVGAALPGDELALLEWLNPPPIESVYTSLSDPVVSGLELRFRELDSEVRGSVTFAAGINVTPTHSAYIWGWSEDGEWAETEAGLITGTSTFTYSMRVVSGTWHVGAVFEDWDNGLYYESMEQTAVALSNGHVVRDLELQGPWTMPQPIIVSFDGSQMQTIIFPNGVELSIPPGAIVTSGTVTLFIFPTKEMRPEPGREFIGVGYEIWAVDQNGQEITQFNQDIVVTFYYDPTQLAALVQEAHLIPVYYSTLAGRWILADSYVLDTANNKIILQISHFTRFGVMRGEESYDIFLPLVLRTE